MRIIYLLTQDLDSPSGLGRYSPLARELSRRGHHVEVFALHPNLPALAETQFELDGVGVHYVAPMHVRKAGSVKSYYPAYRLLAVAVRATWELSRAAIRTPADVVHIAKPHPMNSLAGLAARALRGRRLYLDCDDDETGSGRFGAAWQQRGVAFFERRMPRAVSRITTNTLVMRQRLLESGIPPGRITYLPNGVDRQRFSPPGAGQVEAVREELGLVGKRVVAFIGSLSLPSHPVDLLIAAFARLQAVDPQVALLLAGGGEDLEHCRQQVQQLGIGESVRFVGRVPPEAVRIYYHLADVSVDPVHDDAAARGRSPLKLFESWACGTPFVTAGVGDRRQLSGDPPAALLAAPGDPPALAHAIWQILSDGELAENLRQRGRQRVEDYYWDHLAGQLEAVYKQDASQHSNRAV